MGLKDIDNVWQQIGFREGDIKMEIYQYNEYTCRNIFNIDLLMNIHYEYTYGYSISIYLRITYEYNCKVKPFSAIYQYYQSYVATCLEMAWCIAFMNIHKTCDNLTCTEMCPILMNEYSLASSDWRWWRRWQIFLLPVLRLDSNNISYKNNIRNKMHGCLDNVSLNVITISNRNIIIVNNFLRQVKKQSPSVEKVEVI